MMTTKTDMKKLLRNLLTANQVEGAQELLHLTAKTYAYGTGRKVFAGDVSRHLTRTFGLRRVRSWNTALRAKLNGSVVFAHTVNQEPLYLVLKEEVLRS